MVQRLIVLGLVACATMIDAILPDPILELVTVNGDRIRQKLNDLHTGESSPTGGLHRLNVEYAPMDCRFEKYPGYKYFGTIASSGNWFDSEAICVSVCWQLQQQNWPCASANYIKSKNTCELMQDKHTQSNTGSSVTKEETSTYLIPIDCKRPGQPSKPPTQSPPVQPQPQPQPQPGGGAAGATNNIRPGSCGQSSVPQRVSRSYLADQSPFHRIVGGNEARPHSVPFIVSLRSWNWHFCGGTLIRVSPTKEESDIVVTASHCISGDPNAPTFTVVAGAHHKGMKANGEQESRAVKVVLHSEYEKPTAMANDIAIVKLERPIKFSNTVQPACLPGQNERIRDGVNGIVAGWGALKENGPSPDLLNQVIVPTIPHNKCYMIYSNVLANASLCAGYDQGQRDSCQGDSGGPYFFQGQNGWTLHGVVSWGSGCAQADSPGVYARVSSYYDWIQQRVRELTNVRN